MTWQEQGTAVTVSLGILCLVVNSNPFLRKHCNPLFHSNQGCHVAATRRVL